MNQTAQALLPLLVLAGAFVVLIVLPMRARTRQANQVRAMQSSLVPGNEVMTTSGLFGRITWVRDDTIGLEIAAGVEVTWAKAAVAELRGPASTADDGPADTSGGASTA